MRFPYLLDRCYPKLPVAKDSCQWPVVSRQSVAGVNRAFYYPGKLARQALPNFRNRQGSSTGNWQLYYFPMPELPIVQPRQPQPHEELILVGFRVDASHEGPQFYTVLAVGGENERPLTANGRIIFFTRPQLAAKSLAFDTSLARLGPAP